MIRIGTRSSPLALKQTSYVVDALNHFGLKTHVTTYQTMGDKCQAQPLYDIGGKALFVKELQAGLLKREIDIAVHSLKDCETTHPDGLMLGAVLPRGATDDLLISNRSMNKDDAFTLGTASPRRAAMIRQLYPNVTTTLLRGNVQTRLRKLSDGDVDATILAKAGLERLGQLSDNVLADYPSLHVETLPFVPAACQGIIGIECRVDDRKILDYLGQINHLKTYQQATIERAVIAAMEGNCRTAIGVHAQPEGVSDFRLTVSYWHDTLEVLKEDTFLLNLENNWQSIIDACVKKIRD